MAEDLYQEIEHESEGIYKEKGSKFIAKSYIIHSKEEVKDIIDVLRKEYYDARHFCYAYILGPDKKEYRINDDGEPSGSAGRPIHGQLLSFDVTNVLVVVIRYFGGTKLGVPGLIRAYKESTKEALQNSGLVQKTVNDIYELNFDYPLMNDVMNVIKAESVNTIKNQFELKCCIHLSIRQSESARIMEKFDRIYGVEVNYLGAK
jgi:uncharacterized YigZ family protein